MCRASRAAGEGQPPRATAVAQCRRMSQTVPFTDLVAPARQWHHAVLQIHASGGCDFFVNGRHVMRVRPRGLHPWPARLRVASGGRSRDTDMLIGRSRLAWRPSAPDTAER